ncbi:hypothetical protein [Chamaesiphon sp. VAR_48_metabat_135_sub]|uniref:hypothetical protein n=1 Tax=Chamaesiphon sp. VAR_48_metabat_135_sub TaxID=2964699 RepID=UPI00286AA7C9|nr:hypothetical protein [Chamaesiphon sp. VAR_48_metabat_135_sub]
MRYLVYLSGAIMDIEADLPAKQTLESTEYLQLLEELMLEICESSHNDRQDYYHSDPQY